MTVIIQWLSENKEWLFSGIGVTILVGITRAIFAATRSQASPENRRSRPKRSVSIPIGDHPIRNRIMVAIEHRYEPNLSDIAQALREHRTKIKVIVEDLVRTGHVRRDSGKHFDTYRLTPKGKKFLVENDLL